jgi:hypothetical protein
VSNGSFSSHTNQKEENNEYFAPLAFFKSTIRSLSLTSNCGLIRLVTLIAAKPDAFVTAENKKAKLLIL